MDGNNLVQPVFFRWLPTASELLAMEDVVLLASPARLLCRRKYSWLVPW
jgi:hypothetical protein